MAGRNQATVLVGFGLFCFALGLVATRPALAQDNPSGRKLALLVGVKAYDHADLKNLDFPENDVEELAAVLRRDGFKAVVVLTTQRGQKDPRSKPTAQHIRGQLKSLLQDATKRDLVVVGLAGHGIQPLGSDESYFCPADANPVIKNDRPVNPEHLVSVGEILGEMSQSGVGLKLLLVDACRNDPSARSASRRGVDHVSVAALPVQTGVLLSCSQGEFSFEDKSLGSGHGVFFYHVIKGMEGAARDNDGLVTWDGLGLYVRTKVPSTVERLYGKDGGEQSPNAIGNLRGAPAALARIGPGGFNRPLPQGAQPAPLNAPFNRQKALDARKAWAEYAELAEERKNSLGMALVLIPPGEFRMGSEETFEELVQRFPHAKASVDRHSIVGALLSSASPQHPVRITTPYYLGAFEVTVGQFRKFVNATHYKTDAEQHGKGGSGYVAERGNEAKITQSAEFTWRDWGVDQSDESPVVNVSWNDAAAFCKWLSQKEGATYRLPTEAEWEYACRAGTITRYYNGNDPENVTQIGNVSDATTKAQLPTQTNNVTSSDGWAFTSPVGRFQANNFGLYDMIGNAREWCQDWWSESYYRQSPKLNPTGPPKGSLRVIRGGGWNNGDFSCRSANRFASVPTHRDCIQGFRVVCER